MINNILLYFKLLWYELKIFIFPLYKEYHYSNIGFFFFELTNDLKAVNAFEKSQSLINDKNINLLKFNYFYLGYSYLNIGHFKKALQNFKNYLLYEKNNADVYKQISICYEHLYMFEETLEYLSSALNIEFSYESQLKYSEILYRLKRTKDAEQIIDGILKNNLNSNEIKFLNAIKLRFNGEVKKAVELLLSVKENIKDNPSILESKLQINYNFLLAKFQNDAGDLQGAIATYEKLLETHPGDLWTLNELAVAYVVTNYRLDYALDLIERALKYQPFNSYFLDTQGMIFLKIGKNQEALAKFEESLKLNPNCEDTINHYNKLVSIKT